jgi:hypothetical protein
MKVKFYYGYPLDIDIDTNKEAEVYIDCMPPRSAAPDSVRMVIIEEPLKSAYYNLMRLRRDLYTHLLTFHDEILEENPKARLFHCTNTWVKGYIPEHKIFNVSFIVGGKNDPAMDGYELRHDVWRNQDHITIPKKFYLSGNAPYKHTFVPWTEADYTDSLVLGDSKEPLFNSMFHIAIENCSIKNYFTEKIVDCFQTRTVPIYYGCRNIGEFFNDCGVIQCHSLEDIINACNQVTPEAYERMLPLLEDNYERSMIWTDHDEQIKNAVTLILNEEGYIDGRHFT